MGFSWAVLGTTGLGKSRSWTHRSSISTLSFDGLRGHDQYTIELVTPYVLQSEAPDADAQSVPWWWDTSVTGMGSDAPARDRRLRRREERLAGETHMN